MGVWFGMSEVGVMADEAQDYAILVSLATLEEAEVMASAIRADGIDAFIGNRHHLNVDWGYTLALGGVQVLVPHAKLAEAKDGIRARVREAAADPAGEPIQRTDRYKLWVLIAGGFALWFVGIGMSTAVTIDEDLEARAFQQQLMEQERQQAELDRVHCPSPDEEALVLPGTDEVVCSNTLRAVSPRWPDMLDIQRGGE